MKKMSSVKHVLAALAVVAAVGAEIINSDKTSEDFCNTNPCGEGNTCFNTPVGYKCFCREGDWRDECVKEEQCMLYNHTGICRKICNDDETGFFISHLGGKFMNLRIYNKDGNVTIQDHVPVGNIKEQDPCMWQLTGKPNCCVPTKDTDIGCFAYGSTVRTENKGVIRIEEVTTGDMVESISAEGEVVFSPVVMIMYQEPERTEKMVEIITEQTGSQLTLTHDHLLYVNRGDRWDYIFSERVKPGMMVQVASGDVETVQSVTRKSHQGLYAPVTMTGTIVVDSIAASCYGNHPDHFLSHLAFAPIRLAYQYMPWMYNGDSVTAEGSHPYVSFLNKYLRALTGHSLVVTQYRLDGATNYL